MINKSKVVITSNYTEGVEESIQEVLEKVIKTTTDQLSEEYRRDITVSFNLNIR